MTLTATKLMSDLPLDQLIKQKWTEGASVLIERYWSGEPAPVERRASLKALWTDGALYLLFVCEQHESLVVSSDPQLNTKTVGLWERDVCEAFLQPWSGAGERERGQTDKYYEFEAAPTGEWLDLALQPTADGRITDWEYRSGMTVASRVEPERVVIAMRIPWDAFGRIPKPGEVWRANFFRCVGSGDTRGYLAWQPTLTPKPNFHVPERFGELLFVE